jgi:hypothetical protein
MPSALPISNNSEGFLIACEIQKFNQIDQQLLFPKSEISDHVCSK